MSDFEGARVVITAGAAGIGRAMAERFLAGGARVAVCDVDPAAVEAFRAVPRDGKGKVGPFARDPIQAMSHVR